MNNGLQLQVCFSVWMGREACWFLEKRSRYQVGNPGNGPLHRGRGGLVDVGRKWDVIVDSEHHGLRGWCWVQ